MRPSFRARVRAPPHSMAAPRGPHPVAPAPPPARAGLRAARRASGGLEGASLRGWAGLGGGREGKGRERRARGVAFPQDSARRAGPGGAGREPPGAGPGAAAGTARGVASAPGSQLRARCALVSAPLPVPPLPPLPLRPLLDVSSRSRRGRLFFFSLPFLLCQGSREPRGEASPRTFKGAMAAGTRGAARGSRHEGGRGGVKLASWASGDFLVPSPSGPSLLSLYFQPRAFIQSWAQHRAERRTRQPQILALVELKWDVSGDTRQISNKHRFRERWVP